MKQAPAELLVIDKTYQLLIWTLQHVAMFPKAYRFSLGERLGEQLYGVLEKLLRAKFSRERGELLRAVNLELELIRFQIRMAKDLQCVNLKSYEHAARQVNEIGQMVGGWLKQARGKQDSILNAAESEPKPQR